MYVFPGVNVNYDGSGPHLHRSFMASSSEFFPDLMELPRGQMPKWASFTGQMAVAINISIYFQLRLALSSASLTTGVTRRVPFPFLIFILLITVLAT
jgi:hypothetical protein